MITAVMITRNEERYIEECLRYLLVLVDAVVLYDTGSTDKTREIARSMGAKVRKGRWTDSFAEARNSALSMVKKSTEWCMQVDADERVTANAPIEQILGSNESVDGLFIPVCSLLKAGNTQYQTSWQWRIFRNRPGMYYTGHCHERLRYPDESSKIKVVQTTDVSFAHLGYVPEWNDLPAKRERNRHLLELDILDEPNEPYHYFNMARELELVNQTEHARANIEKAIALWKEQGERNYTYVTEMYEVAGRLTGHLHYLLHGKPAHSLLGSFNRPTEVPGITITGGEK